MLDRWANAESGVVYEELTNEQQSHLRARLTDIMQTNTYNPPNEMGAIYPLRVAACEANLSPCSEVFSRGNPGCAIPVGAVTDSQRLRNLVFFLNAVALVLFVGGLKTGHSFSKSETTTQEIIEWPFLTHNQAT